MTVSLVKFDGSLQSIAQAIELCNGFGKLNPSDRVLIKPNITFAGWMPIPPYGMVTTSKVVEALLWLLAEHGCRHVTIGEGTVAGPLDSNTRRGFRYTGIDRVARRYGARLADLNEGPFEKRTVGDVQVNASRAALESDFLINVPVLKTHGQVKVSLGLKNLKGCIDATSRKRFHNKGLEEHIAVLNELFNCRLTVIDGIYMLEKGPDTLIGVAHRKDVILASQDAFACDCAGAALMGIEPAQVDHLRLYAEIHGRSTDLGSIEIAGEDLESLKENLRWELDVEEALLGPAGITGLSVPAPGLRFCSQCYANLGNALGVFCKMTPNIDLGDNELRCGRNEAHDPPGRRVIIYGDCAIKSNNDLKHAVRVSGCPPGTGTTVLLLMRTLLSRPKMLKALLSGGPQLLAMRAGLYSGGLSKWKRYRSPEFDKSHFGQSRLKRAYHALMKRSR